MSKTAFILSPKISQCASSFAMGWEGCSGISDGTYRNSGPHQEYPEEKSCTFMAISEALASK